MGEKHTELNWNLCFSYRSKNSPMLEGRVTEQWLPAEGKRLAFAWGPPNEDILFSYCGKSSLPDKYYNNSTVKARELNMDHAARLHWYSNAKQPVKNKQKIVQKRVFRVAKSVRNGMRSLQEIKISWATGYDFGNERVSRQIHFVWDNVFWTKLKLKAKFCLQGVIKLLREAVLL